MFHWVHQEANCALCREESNVPMITALRSKTSEKLCPESNDLLVHTNLVHLIHALSQNSTLRKKHSGTLNGLF